LKRTSQNENVRRLLETPKADIVEEDLKAAAGKAESVTVLARFGRARR
jgi:hypothetical protein